MKRGTKAAKIEAGLKLIMAALVSVGAPIELGSETITFSTTYPSPVGIYHRLITTGSLGSVGGGDTILNRDGGNTLLAVNNLSSFVGIGTGQPQAKLDVNGIIKLGTDNSTTCSDGSNGTQNLTGAIRWFVKSGDRNSPSFQVCDGTKWMVATLSNPQLLGSDCTQAGQTSSESTQCSCPGVQGSLIWTGTQNLICTSNADGTTTWTAAGAPNCPKPYNYSCP